MLPLPASISPVEFYRFTVSGSRQTGGISRSTIGNGTEEPGYGVTGKKVRLAADGVTGVGDLVDGLLDAD